MAATKAGACVPKATTLTAAISGDSMAAPCLLLPVGESVRHPFCQDSFRWPTTATPNVPTHLVHISDQGEAPTQPMTTGTGRPRMPLQLAWLSKRFVVGRQEIVHTLTGSTSSPPLLWPGQSGRASSRALLPLLQDRPQ
jgi:hypothetical protein